MIAFFVAGIPAPGGSKKYVGHFATKKSKGVKLPLLLDMGGRKTKDWRKVVAMEAAKVMAGKPLMTTSLSVKFFFIMPRPKSHPKGKTKPLHHVIRPDVLKLSRSTEDALTGIVWEDDSQITHEVLVKRYQNPGEATGARIEVEEFFFIE